MADEIKKAYDHAKNDISNLIGFLQNELEKEPDNLKWEHVGDLNHIKDNLTDSLIFLTGFKREEIENSLQEV